MRKLLSGLKERWFSDFLTGLLPLFNAFEKLIQFNLRGVLSHIEQIEDQGWKIEFAITRKAFFAQAVFRLKLFTANSFIYTGINTFK